MVDVGHDPDGKKAAVFRAMHILTHPTREQIHRLTTTLYGNTFSSTITDEFVNQILSEGFFEWLPRD